MFIIDDRYKNYGLEYTMSYTLTQYQTNPGISRDYVSTFELGSFSANMPHDPLLLSEVGKRGALNRSWHSLQ